MSGWLYHLCALFVLMAPLASSQSTGAFDEPSAEPPEHPVDMQHMRLEVSFEPERGLVKGKVTHVFTPLRQRVDSLFLNGPGIHVLSASANSEPVRWATNAEGITIFFKSPLTWNHVDSVTLRYEAKPRRGLYFIGWNDPTNRSRKQIWTQGQGIDNRHWFPCYDEQNDKLTTELLITFDSSYQVLSNGSVVGQKNHPDGTRTWHYRLSHPQATYLVMLGIGKYLIDHRRTKRGLPVNLWYYPDEPDRVEPTYRYSVRAIEFLEEQTGIPFPWESYSQIPVQDFLYGAMENTTATVFGDFYLVDRRAFLDHNYVAVNAHELTHQWYGDFITARNGRSSWLHESFATYYAKLFLGKVYGEASQEWIRREEQNTALEASEHDVFPILSTRAGSARVYQKGSAVLEMASYVWGPEAFQRVLTYYLKKHAYGNVETNDLYQAFQDVLGVTPWWFFQEWIYRGGEPHYRVSYEDVALRSVPGRRTEITVEQIQDGELFRMPIVFQVFYKDGSSDSVRRMIGPRTERVFLPNPEGKPIAFLLFDPGSFILKRVTFEKTFEELQEQALHAPRMIDRFDAVAALKTIPADQKRSLLSEVYVKDAHAPVRAEIVRQLAADTASSDLVARALRDREAEVRRAALEASDVISESQRPRFEELLRDSSYVNEAAALKKLAQLFPDHLDEYLAITRNDRGIGNQVRVLWHELKAARGESTSLDSLIDMSGISYEFRTRVNSFEALGRLNALSTPLIGNLLQAMGSANGRLSGPATEVARSFCRQSAFALMFRNYLEAHRTEETGMFEKLFP